MAEIDVRNRENKKIDTVNLKDELFGLPVKGHIAHAAVVNFLANQRQGTHSTKTRGMVSGGGKKPWKQKHTGRARAGSSRSPLWRGGAIVFGPQPRDYSYAINRKQRRLALRTALSAKVADSRCVVIDALGVDTPKTKTVTSMLDAMGLSGKSVLIVTRDIDRNVYLSSRNIPNVDTMRASDINTYAVVGHEYLLITKDALLFLQEAMR